MTPKRRRRLLNFNLSGNFRGGPGQCLARLFLDQGDAGPGSAQLLRVNVTLNSGGGSVWN
jgi:hypothetical protein